MKCMCESCGCVFNTMRYRALCDNCKTTLKNVTVEKPVERATATVEKNNDKPRTVLSLFGD